MTIYVSFTKIDVLSPQNHASLVVHQIVFLVCVTIHKHKHFLLLFHSRTNSKEIIPIEDRYNRNQIRTMKSVFLKFAALVLLQEGPTAFAQTECCPADEAVGWKCGQYVYVCPDVPTCDKQGNDESTIVILSQEECDNLKGTELGAKCDVPNNFAYDLSNRVCVSDGVITKFDGSCDTCDPVPTPPPTKAPTESPSESPSMPPTPFPSESPTPDTCPCLPENANSWKCGLNVYYCPGVDTKGFCGSQAKGDKFNQIALTAEQCADMQGTELGEDCVVDNYKPQGLSNFVCYDDNSPLFKVDDSSCDCCGDSCDDESPPPTKSPTPSPTLSPTPSCGCLPENASSWKCGLNVYYCSNVKDLAFCGSQAQDDKFELIELTDQQCADMKGTELGADCVVDDYKPQGLSNFVCYDADGPLIKVDDSSCDSCDGEPTPVPPPTPAPEVTKTEETRTPIVVDPEPPLETCPDDVILIKQEGAAEFPQGTIQVMSQDKETVDVRVKQFFSNDKLEHLFYQHYQSIFSEKCFEKTDIPNGESIDLTIQCTHGSQIALLELWAVDYSLDYNSNQAEIPQCCHADLQIETPVTKYLVEIKCVSSCPGASQ